MIELAAENAPGRVKIGTTSRGIGPAYEDKMGRRGLRVADLLDKQLLKTHIANACREKNTIVHALFNAEPLDADKMFEEYAKVADEIAPFVADTAVLLNKAIRARRVRDVRRRAGHNARHRPRHLSVRHLFERDFWRRGHRHRRSPDLDRHGHRRHQGLLHPRRWRAVPNRVA